MPEHNESMAVKKDYSKIEVPFPFRKNKLEEWSEEFLIFGEMGGRPKVRGKSFGVPGSTPVKTTLFLGCGRTYDKAEAARVAAAERASKPLESAYPLATGPGQAFERRAAFFRGSKSSTPRLRKKCLEPPAVVNINLGHVDGI